MAGIYSERFHSERGATDLRNIGPGTNVKQVRVR
jgi:hypothetical protein